MWKYILFFFVLLVSSSEADIAEVLLNLLNTSSSPSPLPLTQHRLTLIALLLIIMNQPLIYLLSYQLLAHSLSLSLPPSLSPSLFLPPPPLSLSLSLSPSPSFSHSTVPSSLPYNLTVLTLSHTSLSMNWAPPSTPNGLIIVYTLYINYTNGNTTRVNETS